MHLSENIDNNATFLFAKLLNRLTAIIFRVCMI